MAEALLGLISGQGITSAITNIANIIFIWLRKIFTVIWRHIVSLYYKIIDYFMKDPVGAVTMIGELIVFLV